MRTDKDDWPAISFSLHPPTENPSRANKVSHELLSPSCSYPPYPRVESAHSTAIIAKRKILVMRLNLLSSLIQPQAHRHQAHSLNVFSALLEDPHPSLSHSPPLFKLSIYLSSSPLQRPEHVTKHPSIKKALNHICRHQTSR